MSQQPYFETPADGSAGDISAGLTDGCYVGQIVHLTNSVAGLYATAAAAPANEFDYFRAALGEAFEFYVSTEAGPTWVKAEPDRNVPNVTPIVAVAVARVRD